MTSPRLAECEARRASANVFPGVEDTRWPARVSTFWEESAPSPQKSPEILSTFILITVDSQSLWKLELFCQKTKILIILGALSELNSK